MTSDNSEATRLLAEAQMWATQGQSLQATSKAQQALAAAERSGDTTSQALAVLAIAEQSNSVEDCEKAADLFRQCDDKHGEVSALMALGNLQSQAGRFDFALLAGERAMQLLKASDANDMNRILEVLESLVKIHGAKQDPQEAKKVITRTGELFLAANNIAGYSQAVEMMLALCWNEQDWDSAVFAAEAALKVFQAYNHRAGEASMWLAMSKAWVRQEPADGFGQAAEAAQKATAIFAELDMYQAEEDAMQVYNFLDEKTKTAKRKQLAVEPFYKQVRIDGIAYGPAYRINDTMMYNLEGPTHYSGALLMKHQTEVWEDEVNYHPACIDAAGHAGLGFRQARPPPKLTKQQLEYLKAQGQDSGAIIPYMMEHGHFGKRKTGEAQYVAAFNGEATGNQMYMMQG